MSTVSTTSGGGMSTLMMSSYNHASMNKCTGVGANKVSSVDSVNSSFAKSSQQQLHPKKNNPYTFFQLDSDDEDIDDFDFNVVDDFKDDGNNGNGDTDDEG